MVKPRQQGALAVKGPASLPFFPLLAAGKQKRLDSE